MSIVSFNELSRECLKGHDSIASGGCGRCCGVLQGVESVDVHTNVKSLIMVCARQDQRPLGHITRTFHMRL